MRKSLLLVSLLALGTLTGADKAAAQTAVQRCEKASGKAQISACNEAIALDPKSAVAYFHRGNAWKGLGDYDKAISDYDEAIRLNPQHANSYTKRGLAWHVKGNYEKSIADIREAARLGSSTTISGTNAGGIREPSTATGKSAFDLCDRGSDDEKILGCGMFIKQRPRSADVPTAYNNRGLAWSNKEDYDNAIADYSEAIRLDRKLAAAYSNRSAAWNLKGDYDKAIADSNEATRLNPKHPAAYNNRGWAWNKKGDYDKAIADYNKGIKLDPKNAVAHYNRGSAWSAKGDYDKAIADLNEAIRLDPRYSTAYNNRGFAWGNKGDYDKAIADLNDSIRLDPKNAVAYSNRGRDWTKKGDYDKALADLNEAIRLNPKAANPYNHRGTVWNKKGDLDKAIADYREAVRLDPNHAVAQENLQLALEKKQRENARDSSVAAAAQQPTTQNKVATPSAALSAGGKRVALIVGNSAYSNVTVLDNPTRDAELFARTLRGVGFDDVAVKLNLSRTEMMLALKEFEKTAKTSDWAAIYFAGHGIEVGGINYLVPIDAKMTDENSISTQTVNMEYLLNATEVSKKLRLVILDACRNNPYAQQVRVTSASRSVDGLATSSIGRGLGRIEPAPGTLVVYSAKHGELALDGDGKNSPFTEALAKRIEQRPAIEVRRLFDFVREDVVETTRKQQQPFAYGSLSAKDDFYFAK